MHSTRFFLAGWVSAWACLFSPAVCSAQQGSLISPEVHADRRVTFRLRATNATSVAVSGQFQRGPVPLERGSNGVWAATVGPVTPSVYEYSFNVDGVTMIDPGNRAIKPMRNPRTSILEVPGEPPLIHDFQNVPHGAVHMHWYPSKSLGVRRALQVYTPPDYEGSRARYPTLYLFHGSGDNEATWVAHGHAHWILDNLIAQRRAQPMLVVMLDGHAAPPRAPGAPPAERNRNTELFQRDLLEDAMPLVEATYRVKKEAENRAIIGLSMGGGQSLSIGLNRTDLFAWVGGMSSSVPDATNSLKAPLADIALTNKRLRLLWIACGKDDFLLQRNQDFDRLLTERGIVHEYHETTGDHSWPIWRGYLADFAPRLFQSRKK
jgi:enterochelin esterase family protein